MLDKCTYKLLKNLAQICDDGNFKIIETAEMAKALSRNTAPESVRPILKYMQDHELVDIKYSDETKYCLSVLPKGRVHAENYNRKSVDITLNRRVIAVAITGGFIAAFVGAVLANVILKILGY